jgi:hypothetical protein
VPHLQVVNFFNCRSAHRSVFRLGLAGNRLILPAIATELAIILLIDYTPWGNALFGTAPIAASVWLFIVPFAIVLLALDEVRKVFVRARLKSSTHLRVNN